MLTCTGSDIILLVVDIRIPKKFSVSFYILISLQGLSVSKVFWKF